MNNSVTTILCEKYGLSLKPGGKGECPFCHRKTLSVKSDDTLAKCFHPSCERYLTPANQSSSYRNSLYQILDRIFHHFRQELLNQQYAQHKKNAYSYCVEERNIHPRVVAESKVGAIPSGYDIAPLFTPIIQELEKAIETEGVQKKPKGRKPRANQGASLTDRLAFLQSAQQKLANSIYRREGFLAFFYTDSAHRIVAIRFRKPYAKDISYFKPTKCGGVFNHGLFSPIQSPLQKKLNGFLLVVEGEFNQLQLQSMFARSAEAQGHSPEHNYVFSCAVGGVQNADLQTIQKLAKHPFVCYDHDANEAGLQLVESLRQIMPVRAFTTPKIDSDLDDFIRGFGGNHQAAHDAVKDLISNAAIYTRPFTSVKAQIDEVRQQEGKSNGPKRFEVHRIVAEMVIADLKERGHFYHDGSVGYYLLNDEKLLIALQEADLELILNKYGLAPREAITKQVIDSLRLHTLEHGTLTNVHFSSHYDFHKNALYLFDLKSDVYRITSEDCTKVNNGTDGVLFLRTPGSKPFTINTLISGTPTLDKLLLHTLPFEEDILTVEELQCLFRLWIYSFFFPELFPTKPILALIGEKGSGKTFFLRKVGRLLLGPSFDVMPLSDDPKDFDAAVTQSSFVAIDNADRHIPWFPDKLATVATGGSIKRRELYTTNRLVEFRVQAFLGITSRTPHFHRDDIADRLLIFRVRRLTEFTSEQTLLQEFDANRDIMLTEIVGELQRVLKALGDQRDQIYKTSFRMADFANFAKKVAHGQGWDGEIDSILKKLVKEQSSFALDMDPILELLQQWLENRRNIGREVTSEELCRELTSLSENKKIKFGYAGNTRAFAQKLRNLRSALEEHFEITERKAGGRRRYLSFRPRQEKMPGEAAKPKDEDEEQLPF